MSCEAMSMLVSETQSPAWSFAISAPSEQAISSVWEVLSGTSVTLVNDFIDNPNHLVTSLVNATELGLTKLKTTVTLTDDRVMVGILSINVHEC